MSSTASNSRDPNMPPPPRKGNWLVPIVVIAMVLAVLYGVATKDKSNTVGATGGTGANVTAGQTTQNPGKDAVTGGQ